MVLWVSEMQTIEMGGLSEEDDDDEDDDDDGDGEG